MNADKNSGGGGFRKPKPPVVKHVNNDSTYKSPGKPGKAKEK